MTTVEERDVWFQGMLVPDEEGSTEREILGKPRRRALPITRCRQCSQNILEPYQQGTSETVTKKVKGEAQKITFAGRRLKLDPTPVDDGAWFLVSKTAHRRRDDDLHPSLQFFNEHVCLGA